MSARTASILVFDRSELPGDRRRFAAALCFMLFFTNFVLGGTRFFPREDLRPLGPRHLGEIEFWQAVTQVGVSITAYVAGRSLWYGRRWARWWLAGAIVSLLIETGLDLHTTLRWLEGSAWARGWQRFFWIERDGFHELPFILALVAVFWLSRWRVPLLSSRYTCWSILAITWSAGCILASTRFHAGSALPDVLSTLWPAFTMITQPWLVSKAIFCVIISFLLLKSRFLRIAALVLATTEITVLLLYTSLGMPYMVGAAIRGLYASARKCPGWLPSPFPLGICYLNRDTFRWFTELVTQAGPWILIAIYARKYPMRVPPDDGSPWPRAYCGHCGYNLQGIESQICPECGRQLMQ